MTASEIPDVPVGAVLDFPADQWRYGSGDLRLRVSQVRAELAGHYGGEWVWIEGERLTADGNSLGVGQALVRTEALMRALPAGAPEGEVSP